MKELVVFLIIITFYLMGMIQAKYNLPIIAPIAIGICASVFADHVNKK